MYQSPNAATISALMLAKGQAQADAALRSGQAWQQGLSSLGDVIGGSAMSLARYNAAAPQRALTDEQLKEAKLRTAAEQRTNDAVVATDRAFADANGDPDAAAELLGSRGHGEEAMALKNKITAARSEAIQQQAGQLGLTITRLKTAQSLIPQPPTFDKNDAMSGAKALADFGNEYAAALPKVQKIVGDQMSDYLPQPDDPNLVDKVRQLHDFGVSALDRLKARNDALEGMKKVVETAKTQAELNKLGAPVLREYLGHATSQEDWDWAIQGFARMGGTVSGLVPANFSPGNQKAAIDALDGLARGDKEQAPVMVKGADGVTRWTERGDAIGAPVGTPPQQPQQPSQELYPVEEKQPDGTVKTVYRPRSGAIGNEVGSHPSTRSPQSDVVDEVTRRDAETWKANQKSRLELEKRKGGTQDFNPSTGKWETVPTMNDATYKAELQRIEDGYQALIKQPGRSLTPPAARPATTAPTTAAPAAAPTTARDRAKQVLRNNGFADTDDNVDTFLKNPANRSALGLP